VGYIIKEILCQIVQIQNANAQTVPAAKTVLVMEILASARRSRKTQKKIKKCEIEQNFCSIFMVRFEI